MKHDTVKVKERYNWPVSKENPSSELCGCMGNDRFSQKVF